MGVGLARCSHRPCHEARAGLDGRHLGHETREDYLFKFILNAVLGVQPLSFFGHWCPDSGIGPRFIYGMFWRAVSAGGRRRGDPPLGQKNRSELFARPVQIGFHSARRHAHDVRNFFNV